VDEFIFKSVLEVDGKRRVVADRDDLKLDDVPLPDDQEPMSEEILKDLTLWLRQILGERVSDVTASNRLVGSPALVLNTDKTMSPMMRRMMKSMSRDAEPATKVHLQINPRHRLTKNVASLRQKNEPLAKLVAEQVFDNAMIAAGLLDDPRPMVGRIQRILESLEASAPAPETHPESTGA